MQEFKGRGCISHVLGDFPILLSWDGGEGKSVGVLRGTGFVHLWPKGLAKFWKSKCLPCFPFEPPLHMLFKFPCVLGELKPAEPFPSLT